LVLLFAAAAACDSSTGPRAPATSFVGNYAGWWSFWLTDSSSSVNPDESPVPGGPDHWRGELTCPGEFRVTRQDGNRASGTFRVTRPTAPQCTSQRPGFCALPGVPSFCGNVAGTWSGTIAYGFSPTTASLLFTIRAEGHRGPTVEALTGCRVVARRAPGAGDLGDATFQDTEVRGHMMATTINCPAASGFGTIDMVVLMGGVRAIP
jgi:hypothetical protein